MPTPPVLRGLMMDVQLTTQPLHKGKFNKLDLRQRIVHPEGAAR